MSRSSRSGAGAQAGDHKQEITIKSRSKKIRRNMIRRAGAGLEERYQERKLRGEQEWEHHQE